MVSDFSFDIVKVTTKVGILPAWHELEATDPDPEAAWGRQRKTRKEEMIKEQRGKRPSEGSPSEVDLTEGLTTTFLGSMELIPPAAAEVNPLGGRPLGTTIAASREKKKVTPTSLPFMQMCLLLH